MKIYTSQSQISFFTQAQLGNDLEKIFDHTIQSMGRDLLSQVYRDLPECFTQENVREKAATIYKVKLVVMSEAEYAQLLRQRR